MRTFLRILAWNVTLLIALAAVAALTAAARAEAWVFALPAILAFWVLFQGSLFASARWAVFSCAALSALLFLLQVGVLAFAILWNRGFDATYPANSMQVLIVFTALAGAVAVGAFLRAKRQRQA